MGGRQMMRFIESILGFDYSLSAWFSSTKQTIIPGAAFLFLNKLAFLITAAYFIVLPLLPFKLELGIAIGILCALVILTMYGLQSRIKTAVKNFNYSKKYSGLSNSEKILQRAYGLAIFIGCFILMFAIAIVSFTGYGK
jgi:hypothetical protein